MNREGLKCEIKRIECYPSVPILVRPIEMLVLLLALQELKKSPAMKVLDFVNDSSLMTGVLQKHFVETISPDCRTPWREDFENVTELLENGLDDEAIEELSIGEYDLLY